MQQHQQFSATHRDASSLVTFAATLACFVRSSRAMRRSTLRSSDADEPFHVIDLPRARPLAGDGSERSRQVLARTASAAVFGLLSSHPILPYDAGPRRRVRRGPASAGAGIGRGATSPSAAPKISELLNLPVSEAWTSTASITRSIGHSMSCSRQSFAR